MKTVKHKYPDESSIWLKIQNFINQGNGFRDVVKKFKIANRTLQSAQKRGLLKFRSLSQATKDRHKKYPFKHNEETKKIISESMKERHRQGLAHTLGHNRHLSEPSYPEKWWKAVIDNEFNDTNYEQEYRFHRFSIDFAWVDKKIALEIDGEQHYRFEENIERDKRKDKILEDAGWTIIRVPWKECCNNKEEWITKVKDIIR